MYRQMSKAQEQALRLQAWRTARRHQPELPPLLDLSPKWAVSPQLLAFVLGLGLLTLAVLWPWIGAPPAPSGSLPGRVVTLSSHDDSHQPRQPSGLLLPGPSN